MTPLFSGLPIRLRSSDSFGDPGTLGICEVQSLGQTEEGPKSGSGLDLRSSPRAESEHPILILGLWQPAPLGNVALLSPTTNLDPGKMPGLRPDSSSAAQTEPLLRKVFRIRMDWSRCGGFVR